MNKMTSIRIALTLSLLVSAAFPTLQAFGGPDPAPSGDSKQVGSVELLPLPGPAETTRKSDTPPPSPKDAKAPEASVPPSPDLPCTGEALAFCPDLKNQALYRCLAAHVEDLGRLCLLGLRPYANAWFKKSCAADARQFCLGAKGSELLACLVDEQANLSMACGVAIRLAPAVRGKTTGAAAEMPAVKQAVPQ